MHTGSLARGRLFLIRGLAHEVVFNPLDCQELGVVEVPNHPMMGEVLKEERHPSVGIGSDSEGDVSLMNPAP